jgi:hypothetical protein
MSAEIEPVPSASVFKRQPVVWTRLGLLFLFVVASAALVLDFFNRARGPFFQAGKEIPGDFVRPAQGYSFRVPQKVIGDLTAGGAASRIFEDERDLPLWVPESLAVARIGQGLFATRGDLTFSTSDNSDPRFNGRRYTLVQPIGLSDSQCTSLQLVWLCALLALCWCDRFAKVSHCMNWLKFLARNYWLILSLPSVYLLVLYPPLWGGADSAVQLLSSANASNILHYGPAYCFLGRVPFWISSILETGHAPGLFEPQVPTAAGLQLLIVLQHLSLVVALALFLKNLSSNASERAFAAVLLVLFSPCS